MASLYWLPTICLCHVCAIFPTLLHLQHRFPEVDPTRVKGGIGRADAGMPEQFLHVV